MKKVNLLILFLFGLVTQSLNAQCISGDCINGTGTWKWESGATYTGEFKDGTRSGYGQYTFQNGDIYVGEWQSNRRHGYGVYHYKSRDEYQKYIGEWYEDIRQGIGVMHFKGKTVKPKFGVWKSNKYLYKYKELGCIEGNCYNGFGTYVWNDGSRYEGNFKNGERNGEGIYYYPKGAKYIGKQVDGKRNGWGTYYYPNGDKYEGEWKNDEKTGKGTMYKEGRVVSTIGNPNTSDKTPPKITIHQPKIISKHNGGSPITVNQQTLEIRGSVSDESGIARIRTNGSISELSNIDKVEKRFVGEVVLKEGKNEILLEAEDKAGNQIKAIYEIIYDKNYTGSLTHTEDKFGCISGDCINGFGTFKWESGAIHTGYFVNGNRQGYGFYTFVNGDKYIGEWQNNERHGFGVYYYTQSNYTQYIGEWKNGTRSGIGKMDYSNGTPSRFGIWKKDKYIKKFEKLGCVEGDCYTGFGIYVWNDRSRYEGNFKNGERNGEGIYYYPKGAKYIGNQVNGKRNGSGTYYYPSGSKYVGEWENEVKNGEGTMYMFADDSIIIKSGTWKNGQQQIETD